MTVKLLCGNLSLLKSLNLKLNFLMTDDPLTISD